jgi:flagellar hook-associated protein 1
MPSILNSLDSVQQALATQQFGLAITQKNVANANDPNYTRQDIEYTSNQAEWARSGVQGVTLDATRNSYIDHSVSQELQSLGKSSIESSALKQIDAILGGNGEGLQQAISDFFSSFNSLSSSPEDLTLRQKVLSSAEALSQEFQRIYGNIQKVQTSQDQALSTSVSEINSITSQIADLNAKISTAQASHSEDEFTLRDSRQGLIEQLSSLVDLSYFETESGALTITTANGGLLVSGNQSHSLEVSSSSSGAFQGIYLDGSEITGSIQSGKLGGLIDVRDNQIAGYLSALDDLSATIISRVNEQHAAGSDLNGDDGGDFFDSFTPVIAGSTTGAARTMAVAITDPSKIAAAASGTGVGNNENANLLASISDEQLFSASTVTEFYGTLIAGIGNDEKAAEDNVSTQNSVLDQLKSQRSSFSGVNLDEEAVNIIKYQKAYQASARYATVLDTLSDEILQILG